MGIHRLVIPGSTAEMLNRLIDEGHLSIAALADRLGVTKRTIHRLRQGGVPSSELKVNLISLYISEMRCN